MFAVLFVVFLMSSSAFGQDEIHIDEDQLLNIEISQALAREDKKVTLSYEANVDIEEGDLRKARKRALYQAFRHLVKLATAQIVDAQRLEEVSDLAHRRIFKKARQFVHRFRSKKSQVTDGKYVVPLIVTLNLETLYTALLDSKVLNVDYVSKEIRLYNVTRYKDYQFMKLALEKRIRNLKRIVETYQKKNQFHFSVETSSSLQEIIERLHLVRRQDNAPLFKVIKNEDVGGLEITFIK